MKLTATPASVYLAGHVDAQVSFTDEGLVATVSLKVAGSRLDGSTYEFFSSNQQVTRSAVDAAWPTARFGINVPKDLKEGEPLHFTETVTDSINQSTAVTSDVALLTDSIAPQIISLTPVRTLADCVRSS